MDDRRIRVYLLDDRVTARDLVELLAELRRGRRRLQELVDEAH